jgi:hypothetical protein
MIILKGGVFKIKSQEEKMNEKKIEDMFQEIERSLKIIKVQMKQIIKLLGIVVEEKEK